MRSEIANRRAIFAWYGIKTPFPERIRHIRDAGFDTTCLWWEEDHPIGRAWRDRAVECVRETGLGIDHLHAPYRGCNRLWSANPGERSESVLEHVGWVHDCARHGIPILVMHPTLGAKPPEITPAGLDSFRRIVHCAEDVGVTVALENMRANTHLEAVFRALTSPYLGFCYDVSHDRLWSKEPLKLLHDWGHRVVTTHLGDTDGKRDRHWLPGEGVAPLSGAIELLAAQGYTGAYVLEVAAARKADAMHFLHDAHARLTALSTTGHDKDAIASRAV